MATRKKSWSKLHAGPAKSHRPKPRASRASSKGRAWKARQFSRLGQAYRRTAYRLVLGGGGEKNTWGPGDSVALVQPSPHPVFGALLRPQCLDIQPGHANPALAQLLRCAGARRYAVITACNPGSRQLDAADNAARQAWLAERLTCLKLRFFPACNGPDASDWPAEPSFLVLDAPLALLRRLGRACGQNALVAGRRGGRPRLVWLHA